jgi:hypothetical protein
MMKKVMENPRVRESIHTTDSGEKYIFYQANEVFEVDGIIYDPRRRRTCINAMIEPKRDKEYDYPEDYPPQNLFSRDFELDEAAWFFDGTIADKSTGFVHGFME